MPMSPRSIAQTGLRPPQARGAERFFVARLFAQMPVHHFLDELHALELQKLSVLVVPSIERHSNRPRPCENLRILDRGPVIDAIRPGRRKSLHDMERFAVKIACPIEPRLVVEARHVDDERVTLPAANRLSHPR